MLVALYCSFTLIFILSMLWPSSVVRVTPNAAQQDTIMLSQPIGVAMSAPDTGIVDYRPSEFQEVADSPFFYVIDGQLKHGVSIDPNALTLFSATPPVKKPLSWSEILFNYKIKRRSGLRVYPSPDNRKAAVIDDEKLYLVQPEKTPVQLLENVDVFNDRNEISFGGEPWHRSEFLQWDASSRYIHIVLDKKPSFLHPALKTIHRVSSDTAQLVRLDTQNLTQPKTLVDRFHAELWWWGYSYAARYFLVGEDVVCSKGLFQRHWECATPKGRFPIKSYSEQEIILENGESLTGRQFVSVDRYQNAENGLEKLDSIRRHSGLCVKLVEKPEGIFDGLFSEDTPNKPLLLFRKIHDTRDYYNSLFNTNILPGGRYIPISLKIYLGDEARFGQILLDRKTGKYRELPKNTRIYFNDANRAYGKKLTPRILWRERDLPTLPLEEDSPEKNPQACPNEQRK
ncbi:MAG: hypothetical protein LBD67_01345 [Candidatus Accumulibacter sp.]|nr:hypothetical protein [Accumulibacter sp.]